MSAKKVVLKTANGLFLFKQEVNQESNWRSDHCYKFIYSANGSMTYQTNRNQISLDEQQFLLLNPHDEHKQIAMENTKFLIEIEPSFLNRAARAISSLHFDVQFASCTQRHPSLTKWVHFVLDYVQLEEDGNSESMELFLEHSFSQLALILVKNAIGTQSGDIHLQAYKTIQPQLYKTLQAMKENFQHPWTLDEMADLSYFSKFQFAHYFKEIVGISPYSWLQLYRGIRSQDVLINTNKTVLKIAIECGFSSVSVYNQLFKRLYGITPRSFRTMARK